MADVPVPDTTAEEEFDLFGPGPAGAAAGAAQPEANPFAPAQGPAPAPAQATAQPSVPAAATSSPTSAPVPPVQSYSNQHACGFRVQGFKACITRVLQGFRV